MESNHYRVLDKTVRVYWNSHRNLYSIQHQIDKKWKILSYATEVVLADVKFIVNPTGSQKVKDTNTKNVHAYAEGRWVILDDTQYVASPGLRFFQYYDLDDPCSCGEIDCVGQIIYNPSLHTSFMDVETNTPITEAPFCSLETWLNTASFGAEDQWRPIDHPHLYNYKLPKLYKADVYAAEHL
jgi:hypothetical protein